MTFKIAAVQLNIGAPDAAIVRSIKSYLKKAKQQRVNIVCFPEATLSEGPKKNLARLQEIARECKANNLWAIVAGRFREKGAVYNTASLISHEGTIVGRHRKVHICDAWHVRPGTGFEIYRTPFSDVGLAICWDVNDPNTLLEMARKGADVIFCPMYWNYELWAHAQDHLRREKELLRSLLLTRAFENLVYVVFCNPVDKTNKTTTPFSGIAEPHRVIKSLFGREGMIVAEVDLDYLKRIRERYRKEYNKVVAVSPGAAPLPARASSPPRSPSGARGRR